MIRKKGFTLVELLVVVAIITILASIVVPNVTGWIGKARVAKALSEIKNAELCLNKMLTDAEKSNFRDFFTFNARLAMANNATAAADAYRNAMYLLLRAGKEAVNDANFLTYGLDSNVVKKLGTAYMDIGMDPWGKPYQFWMGPFRKTDGIYFRIYQPNMDLPPVPIPDAATFTETETAKMIGYPAPRNKNVYIYSFGDDGVTGQVLINAIATGAGGTAAYDSTLADEKHMGGGDDINNWDTAQSWNELYD